MWLHLTNALKALDSVAVRTIFLLPDLTTVEAQERHLGVSACLSKIP
jgi:hypothetical protein